MAEAGVIVGVQVLDHIIVAEAPAFVSLKQRAGGRGPRITPAGQS